MSSFEDLVFKRVKELLEEYDSASIQKKSFDFFIHHRLPRIIEEEPTLNVNLPDGRIYRVSFGQVFVDKPYIIDENRQIRYITPNEARIRELTYSSLISVNIKTSIVVPNDNDPNEEIERESKEFFKIHLARIPMMIGTSKCNLYGKNADDRTLEGECRYDTGGYFIIKGKERVLVTQERMNYNIVYVFEQKASSKFLMIADIRSMSDETGHSVLVQMKITNDIHKKVMLQIPYITQEVYLGYVFRAYDFSIEEIRIILWANLGEKYYNHPEIIKIVNGIIRDAEMINTKEKALNSIAVHAVHTIAKDRRMHYVSQILHNELFPHLGITSSRNQKGFFLGHVLNKLLSTFIKIRPEDDRDHISNKRFEASGHLMSELFRTLFKRFVRAMEPQLVKRPDIIVVMSRMNMITQGIKHCFSTGNWGIPKSSYIRTGVSQILSRLTYNAFLSHLRRVIIPIGKEGKNTKIRQIHSSQIGFICPSETPEGHSAGIVKNLTVICQITPRADSVFLRMIIESTPGVICGFDFNRFEPHRPFHKIFINGNWIGISYDRDIIRRIFDHRHQKRFPTHVSISYNTENEIMIFGDEGRLIRPLFVGKNMPTGEDLANKTFSRLIEDGHVQFFDSHEIENNVVAMFPHEMKEHLSIYNLCEIHPSLLVSLCVGLIPFVDHTQAPRITYHASMGKQAIGLYASTNNIRTDTIAHVLTYPEKPLVRTHISEFTKCDDLASGNNLIVAIAMYTGFNQEDSVILNQSSIQRGMFRSMGFRTIIVEERKKSTMLSESIEIPVFEHRIKSFNFSKLDARGIVKPGVFVGSGDVVVARVQIKTTKQGQEEKTDASVIIKSGEEGFVDRVFISVSPDGYKIVKIKIRSYKIPEIGDKVCSRNAQKGTVGLCLPQEDMPFTSSGIVPDIIINPLCLPSRMTINQIIECMAAKCAVNAGKYRYATAFSSHSHNIVDSLCDELHRHGFQKHGYETMYNGITGEMMEAKIFIGPTYYQRLKHLVGAKIHARNHGSIQALTRQPLEGRSRDGGLRFGEMEKDCHPFTSRISCLSGLSIEIGEMYKFKKMKVLGFKDGKVQEGIMTEFVAKGERKCVIITLEDGRTVKCTPEHKMLVHNESSGAEEWIMAKDTCTRLMVCGLSFPLMRIYSELEDCCDWSMKCGSLELDCRSLDSYMKSLAVMRIIGILIMDGTVYQNSQNHIQCQVSLGTRFDVETFLSDLKIVTNDPARVCGDPINKIKDHCYTIYLPSRLSHDMSQIPGILIGKKVCQDSCLPEFVQTLPRPLLREFLGGVFGGDGHTCVLGKHRGKRDLLTSISFSKSRVQSRLDSLTTMMKQMRSLLGRCGIDKDQITIQNSRQTSYSRKHFSDEKMGEKVFQVTLHLAISQICAFHENIGFRYCAYKSLRLEAAASYYRLRSNVARQHEVLVNRVDELTKFSILKHQDPTKNVPTKKAILKAVDELKKKEALVHDYAIPSTHDITDHLIKGTRFGKFTSKHFPTAEEYVRKIGCHSWFIHPDNPDLVGYPINREDKSLPTMRLRVIDVRPVDPEPVFDIQVDETQSFLANGVVAHNCMISHGVSRFLTERLFDMSDRFVVPTCPQCGTMPNEMSQCMMCGNSDIVRVPIPYACKLLFQELNAMGIKTKLLPASEMTKM